MLLLPPSDDAADAAVCDSRRLLRAASWSVRGDRPFLFCSSSMDNDVSSDDEAPAGRHHRAVPARPATTTASLENMLPTKLKLKGKAAAEAAAKAKAKAAALATVPETTVPEESKPFTMGSI